MLDAIGAGLTPRIGDRDWKDVWLDSPEYQRMRREIEDIKRDGLSRPAPDKSNESTCTLLHHLAQRHVLTSRKMRPRSGYSSKRL